jgi:hypothetical protein
VKLAACMLCLLSGSLALAGELAKNPHLAAIQKYFNAGKLDQVESELRAAKEWKANTSVDWGRIAIFEGMVFALSAEDEQARGSFSRALALDPQATLPDGANARVRKMFDAVRAEARSTAPAAPAGEGKSSGRNLPAEFEQQCAKGDLKSVEKMLAAASAQGLSELESGQVLILRGMLENLKAIQEDKASPEYCRSHADDLEASEARLGEDSAKVKLSDSDAAQFLSLRTSMLAVCGMLRMKAGDEKLARAVFRKALALNPKARLPAIAPAKTRRAFEEAKGQKP